MRNRRGIIAAGITIGSLGVAFATAGAALAATPTLPAGHRRDHERAHVHPGHGSRSVVAR